MKIDLHIHASERSGCSISTQEEQIAAAKAVGLDGIAFSDHDRLVPLDVMHELRKKHDPFRIFTSIEVTIVEGEHVLVAGVYDEGLQEHGWDYPRLHTFVRERNGFLAIAHPGRFQRCALDLVGYPPDAIEVASCNISPEMVPGIRELAQRVESPLIVTSDAHKTDAVGMNYLEFEEDLQDDAQLVRALRAGRYTCCGSGVDV